MTKDELSKIKKIKQEIEQIKRELYNAEPQYVTDSVTASSKEFPYTAHQVKIKGYDLGAYNRKVMRIRNRLSQKFQELLDEKDKITEYIYGLDDGDIRQILSYKYVNGMGTKEIGECMGWTSRTIERRLESWNKSIK